MMKKRFQTHRNSSDQMNLQITSMADMFMIVLVFLLKSFSTQLMNVAPSAGTLLPEAHAQGEMVEALKLEISDSALQVEGQTVGALEKAHFPSDPQSAKEVLLKLTETLDLEKKKQNFIASQNSDVKVNQKILILAGKTVPYSTLKIVLATAASHGYSDFKLVVARKEGE